MKIKISCIRVSIHFWPTTIISLARTLWLFRRQTSWFISWAVCRCKDLLADRITFHWRWQTLSVPLRKYNIQLPASLQQSVHVKCTSSPSSQLLGMMRFTVIELNIIMRQNHIGSIQLSISRLCWIPATTRPSQTRMRSEPKQHDGRGKCVSWKGKFSFH